jgi:hypothetical protein
MATIYRDSRAFREGQMKNVRLGNRERALLLAAALASNDGEPAPLRVHGFNLDRAVGQDGEPLVIEEHRSARVAAVRAAKRLDSLGLVDYDFDQRGGERRAFIKLTELGNIVVKGLHRELANGERISWQTLGG